MEGAEVCEGGKQNQTWNEKTQLWCKHSLRACQSRGSKSTILCRKSSCTLRHKERRPSMSNRWWSQPCKQGNHQLPSTSSWYFLEAQDRLTSKF